MAKSVTVLGAGVIGLSSAVLIKQTMPGVEVTVVADKFSPDTTSDGSGGFWEPYALGDTPLAWVRETSAATFRHLKQLAYSSHAQACGAQVLSGYALYADVVTSPDFFHDILDGYRELTQKELEPFPEAKSGFFFTTLQIDVATYLPWLTQKFRAMGGKLKRGTVTSLGELRGQSDLVVNCAGLGARDLLHDTAVVPIRGQVTRVQAPWLKHFYFFIRGDRSIPPEVYVLPGTSSIVLGGTADVGQWDTTPSDDVANKIWAAATKLLPQLESAKVVKKWAGLRPGRTTVRLEREVIKSPQGEVTVIHNYGHGGAGVTLHWGCALQVTDLVKEELFGREPRSRL